MPEKQKYDSEIESQHALAGITATSDAAADYERTTHPDAQWFPNAGLGMFFHWGISSVSGKCDLSVLKQIVIAFPTKLFFTESRAELPGFSLYQQFWREFQV